MFIKKYKKIEKSFKKVLTIYNIYVNIYIDKENINSNGVIVKVEKASCKNLYKKY